MFPTLTPEPTPSLDKKPSTRSVANLANTAALPADAPIAGAQVAGLAALVLAFILAVTRLSVRRHPAARQTQEAVKPTQETADKPTQETADKPTQEAADKPNAATTGKPADQQDSGGGKDTGETAPPSDGE